MSEANKAVALKFLNALGRGDAATLKTVMTEDIVANATGTSILSGKRGYQDLLMICDVFPKVSKTGLILKPINVTAEGNRVACEMQGECKLVNGQDYNNGYHFLVFIRDGKVCGMNEYFDTKLADNVLGPVMASLAG